MGDDDDEVPSSGGKRKDSSLERGITDSSGGDNDSNGESTFNGSNETISSSSSSHGHQEDGRDQELGFPTSNTAQGCSGIHQDEGSGYSININETNEIQDAAADDDDDDDRSEEEEEEEDSSSINQHKGSGERNEETRFVLINQEEDEEEEEEEEDTSGTRLLLGKRLYGSGESSHNRGNHSWSAIDYLKEVITSIRGISEVLRNNQSLEARVNSQEERITQMENDLEARYQASEKEATAQTEPDQFASAVGYLKEIANAVVGITQAARNIQSLEGTIESQNATILKMEKDLKETNDLKEIIKSHNATIEQLGKDLEAANQNSTTETKNKAEQKEINDEENKIHEILETSLERSIITMASFFVAYHSLLAYSQQPKNDFYRFIVIMFLIAMIWIATIMLLVMWWLGLQGIGERIVSLQTRRLQKRSTLKWHLFRILIIFLGIFATGFTVYFVCITYSLWSTTEPIASPPSAIQLFSSL